MSAPLDLAFVRSADTVDAMPPSRAEVCVAGRSNVGKSSLLNALAKRRELAHTSGTPGRTQLLNVFELASGGTLVDLPGFGYAKTSRTAREAWQDRTAEYLTTRIPLRMILLLVDGMIGPTKLDVEQLAWLREHDLSFTVVATKHDRVKPSKRERRRIDLAAGCDVGKDEVVWTSAQTGTGIDGLRDRIRGWLA